MAEDGTEDGNMNMRESPHSVAQALEASLLCTLLRADVTGPGTVDLHLKVNVEGPNAATIVNALVKTVSEKTDFTGKACLDHDACERCQTLIEDVLHFGVVFGGRSGSTCRRCGPVRRSARKRSKTTHAEDFVYVDKGGLPHGDPSRKKKVKKSRSTDFNESSNDRDKHPRETVCDLSICDKKIVEVKSKAKDLVCEICEDSFCEEGEFVDHLIRHSDSSLLKCAVCGGSFSSKYVLKKHMMRHVPEEKRPYRCEICKKGFTEAFYYREHARTHIQTKPYKCTECPKRYSSRTALRRHSHEHISGKANRSGSRGSKSSKSQRSSKADVDGAVEAAVFKEGGEAVLVDEVEECIEEEQELKGDSWENIGSGTELLDSRGNDSETNKTEQIKTVEKAAEMLTHQCCICNNVFQSKSALNDHAATHISSTNVIFKCKICAKNFVTENGLIEHQSVHTSDRPYPCNVCDKSFFNRQVMERHASKHVPPEKWEHICGVCHKKFSHISYLNDHKWIHADEKPYKCGQCDKCYVSSQSLRKHTLSHQTGVHKCSECHRRFPTVHRLTEHAYSHTGILPFGCEVCGKRFKLHQAFAKHGQVHATVRPLSCEDCEKRFYAKHDLDIHMRIHSGYRPFQCDVCGKTYTTKGILQNHVQTHSDNYYILKPCAVCGKELRGDRALHQHLLTHREEKRYVCDQCGKRFPSKKSLWSHKQTHRGYKPHACKHCGKRFRGRLHCRNHMKTHTGENLVQCPLCQEWFTDTKYLEKVHPRFCKSRQVFCNICGRGLCHNQALQSHIGLHTGARPHGCETCGRAFTKERCLNEHKKRHLQTKSHLCRTCGKRFNRPADLKNHESRQHADRQVKALLSDSVKQIQEKQILAGVGTSTSASIAAEDHLNFGGNILGISGPDTSNEEVHNISDVGDKSDEYVVLATIDINQIRPGSGSQDVSHHDYSVVQQTSTGQYRDSMQPVLQQQEVHQHQHPQLVQHEYILAADEHLHSQG